MPNPPPPSPSNSSSDLNNWQESMPDIPDSLMTPSMNKIQTALNNHGALGDSNDRNATALINGIDHGAGENVGDVSQGSAVSSESTIVEDAYYPVKTLKTDFYEKANGDVVVRVTLKPLDANTVSVFFAIDRFDIVFRTKDPKFLAAYEGTNEETRFRWTCHLAESVKPEQCKVRVQNLVEITLRKENPIKKWTSLCAVQTPVKQSAKKSSDLVAAAAGVSASPISPIVAPKSSSSVPTVEFVSETPPTATKPTCKVPPYNEIGHLISPGYTGLRNFGNTCFMNAPLQALINTREFRDYFLEKYYLRDINRTNPLGFKGRLAEAFGQFVSEMWSGMNRYFEPCLLKELVGLKASQFANFAQHDAQEFLSFLLDGLHEDLNRVGDNKPLTPTVESDGRPDGVVADAAWRFHQMRNDSMVVDLFHGQLKSRLDCPTCGHTSITFDPFVYLPVPFPKSRRPFTFYFWSTDPYAKPVKFTLSFVEDDTRIMDVFARLSSIINVKPSQLRMIEVFRQKIFKRFNADDRLALIRANDVIFVFQVYDPEEVGEEVVELTIVQRQLQPRIPVSNHCAACSKESQDLRACTKCRTAAYCDVTCQKSDWTIHRSRCRPPSPELVGQPFMISLPTSRLTYRRLIQALEARARHTVDVFQTPVVDLDKNNDVSENRIALITEDASTRAVDGESNVSQATNETVAMAVGCDGRPTKRMRVVFGEPHQQPGSNPLFQLAVTNDDGEYVLLNGKEKRISPAIEDDRPLVLEQGTCIAVDWINKKGRNLDHLVVLTKDELEFADGPSTGGGHVTSSDESLQLSELFEHFTETETLSAEDAWYCSRCREHRQAKKTLQLWRLPTILIVQLKRFVYTSNIFRNKIDKHVVYPIRDLDVRPYMPEGATDNQVTTYDLYAVVCHSGTSFFGHYTGFARLPSLEDPTRKWRSFDDTSVSRVQRESQLVDPDAYFLFYKRRDCSSAALFDRYKNADADMED